MSNIIKSGAFSLTPTTLDEAMKYADMLAKSTIVPKGYQNRAGDILVAVQMGQELGLKPIQALQNIAVINGKPSIYGDSLLALVKAHPACEDVIETFDPVKMEATCIAKRKGKADVVQTFSKERASKAQLWGKQGPWTQYPERMLQLRARGFALRDQFPDVLQGLILAEEAQDYPIENVTPQPAPVSKAAELANRFNPVAAEPVAVNESVANNNVIMDVETDSENKSEVSVKESASELAAELRKLIKERNVPEEKTSTWLEKAGVKFFEEMKEETLTGLIALVEDKY